MGIEFCQMLFSYQLIWSCAFSYFLLNMMNYIYQFSNIKARVLHIWNKSPLRCVNNSNVFPWWMHHQTVIPLYNGILFSNTKEQIIDTYNNTNRAKGKHVELKKSVSKGYKLYDSTDITFLQWENYSNRETNQWTAGIRVRWGCNMYPIKKQQEVPLSYTFYILIVVMVKWIYICNTS